MATDEIITRFLSKRRYYAIYPGVLSAGLFLRAAVPESLYTTLQNTYWVSSKNIINRTFAHNGNQIFFFVFVALFIIKLYHHARNNAFKELFLPLGAEYSARLAFKYAGLWALFYIIDHLFLATGGSCVVTPEFADVLGSTSRTFEDCAKVHGTWVRINDGFCSLAPGQYAEVVTSAERCYEVGQWVGGFDVSGHYCFLMTLSLILWNELKGLQEEQSGRIDVEAQQKVNVDTWFEMSVVNTWRWMTSTVLLIWINMLFVTAMFYHTFTEKVIGLVFGYVVPLVIYELLPKVLNGYI